MNRYEFERAVYESGLNRTCKQILIYFAFRKNWNNDTKVWGTSANIGKAIDVSGRTVETWTPKLREMGWLIDTGERRQGNGRPVIVYDLAVGTLTEVISVNSTEDLTETISEKSGNESIDGLDLNRNDCGKVGDLTEMVADLTETISVEQGINKIKEEQVSTLPAPKGPVDLEEEFSIREDENELPSTSSNNEVEKSTALPNMELPGPSLNVGLQDAKLPSGRLVTNRYEVRDTLITVSSLTRMPKSVYDRALELATDAEFLPDVEMATIRVNDAAAIAWQEYDEGRTADE